MVERRRHHDVVSIHQQCAHGSQNRHCCLAACVPEAKEARLVRGASSRESCAVSRIVGDNPVSAFALASSRGITAPVLETSNVHCVWPAGALLGEGPVWDADDGVLYWVDIEGRKIFRYGPEDDVREVFEVDRRVGAIALRRRDGFVVAAEHDVAFWRPGRGFEVIGTPESDPQLRFNDGKCDEHGRFWFGSMHEPQREALGSLYRLSPAGEVSVADTQYCVANGPTFSPDGTIAYHTDSRRGVIYAFDCSTDGELSRRRQFVRIDPVDGVPDGMTTDAEGFVWVAHFGGARVTRFSPAGEVERVVTLPVSNVTSVCFGGDDLRTLFITTASVGLEPAQREREALAGGLFAVALDITGRPSPRFAG